MMGPGRRSPYIDIFVCASLVALMLIGCYQFNEMAALSSQLHHLTKMIQEQPVSSALPASQQQVQPVTYSNAGNVDKQNLYLGDGMVMCYVVPLGVHMVLEGADKGMTPHFCRGVGWEAEIASVLRRLARPGYHVLDVGTNVGYYTIMFAKSVGPRGRVIGIEANPRTYHLAQRTLEFLGLLSGNTQLMHKAAYSEDGKVVKMTMWKDRPLNNRITEDKEDTAAEAVGSTSASTSVDVPTTTVDAVVAPWQRLDLIKIDVEGAEADVYAGMRSTIRRFPNVVIVMEVNTARMGASKAQPFYEAMQKDFSQLRRIVGSSIRDTTVAELMGNTQSDELVVLSSQPVLM